MAHIKYTICEKIVRVKLYWLLVIEDVNKTQICVNIDAFTWHTLIFTILSFEEHRIIAPVCTGTSAVTTKSRPALHNQCLFSECEKVHCNWLKRILYFCTSATGSVYIYIYMKSWSSMCLLTTNLDMFYSNFRWIPKMPMIPHFKFHHWMKIARPNRVTQPHSTPHESAPKEERWNIDGLFPTRLQ